MTIISFLVKNSQIYFPHFKAGHKFSFNIQCPGEFINNVFDLQLLHHGEVHGNIHYYDLCKVLNYVNIAYNEFYNRLKIKENTLVDFPLNNIKGQQSVISLEFEIIGEFLTQNNIIPTWIHSNQIFGIIDEETGEFSGEMGYVRLTFL